MNEVKWIKIAVDIFDNRKIKQIEKLPEGDAIIVIWLQLLCLAGSINENGFIVMTKDIAYTDELLANAFNRSLTVIRLALDIFVKFGMIELIDDVICISNWEKYQNADKLLAIREYNKIAKQKEREKKRLLMGNVIDKSLTSQGQSIDCQDTDIDRDIELDKEIDKDKEIEILTQHEYDFKAFWEAYPKKVGKKEAQKAWSKVKVDIDVILNALEIVKNTDDWNKQNGKFIPYPATWLNGARWEDEIQPINASVNDRLKEWIKECEDEQTGNRQITCSH
jgi:predicted phage replisome organizer